MCLTDKKQVVIDTNKSSWHPGHGNLEVKSLTDNAAFVKWPKGARFKDHSHHGGEEILVLTGEFIDEHGRYPKGTWIRSPHLSTHFPFVEEETIIFVKTGHLLSN
jgi:anti-sigma factor ChrR (cupin superfamily)